MLVFDLLAFIVIVLLTVIFKPERGKQFKFLRNNVI